MPGNHVEKGPGALRVSPSQSEAPPPKWEAAHLAARLTRVGAGTDAASHSGPGHSELGLPGEEGRADVGAQKYGKTSTGQRGRGRKRADGREGGDSQKGEQEC